MYVSTSSSFRDTDRDSRRTEDEQDDPPKREEADRNGGSGAGPRRVPTGATDLRLEDVSKRVGPLEGLLRQSGGVRGVPPSTLTLRTKLWSFTSPLPEFHKHMGRQPW